jgi:phosphatidylglycerol---prolipoprotein diacylglyceryl transferase
VPELAIYVNLDPIAFRLGSIEIGWYGIMVVLAIITITSWALWWSKKHPHYTTDQILNAALVGIPSGIIFARLLHVVDLWSYYSQHPGQIIGGSGLSIWGAVLGAALGIWIYSRFTKISFAHLADMLAPGIILAQAVGRIGCTILGDDTGHITSLPWGFIYTSPNSPTNQAVGLAPTHPVVTYEILYALIVFGILMLLRKRLKPDGSIFAVYLALYSAWRIGSDFLRDGTDFLFGLHEAQFIGLVTLVICVGFMVWKTRWVNKEDVQEELPPPEQGPETTA